MSNKRSFGLGYHRLSKSTKWRRCKAENPTSWQSDSSSDDGNSTDNRPASIALPQSGLSYEEAVPHLIVSNEVHSDDHSPPNNDSYSSSDENEGSEVPLYSSDESCSRKTDSSETGGELEFNLPCSSTSTSKDAKSSISPTITFLQKWAVSYNVPLSSLDALLKGLKSSHPCFVDLPSCGRTILNTPSNLEKHAVDPGFYVHLGLKDQLITLMSSLTVSSVDEVKLMVNVDGLPPFKSSQGELYPILVSVLNIQELRGKVIPVGLYYGVEKPRSVTEFLMPFINELIELLNSGIRFDDTHINVSLAGFCCDAPAKSYVMGIIGHGGFYSCTRCIVKGVTFEKKRVFLQADCSKRTHEDFINKADEHFSCKDDTPLLLIPSINFVNSFVLDYMHLVCLGVVRTLLVMWTSGTKSLKASRISKTNRTALSEQLVFLTSSIPCEFSRKTRNLGVLLRWKATEFRLFLLYVGPVVLRGILNDDKYSNFLELHIAMTILLSPLLCKDVEARENSRKLLIHFVKSVAVLYGDQLITHNFHGLYHIVDDADYFVNVVEGFTLDDISAFQFENYLQTLKRLIRGKNRPLEQICKRLTERFALESDEVREKFSNSGKKSPIFPYFLETSTHSDGPLLALCCAPQYRSLVFKSFKITTSTPDSCCGLSNGDIIRVNNFAYSTEKKEMVVIGRKFIDAADFYQVLPSSQLGVFKVKKLSQWNFWPVSRIDKKYVCLPHKNGFVVFPLLHTN